MRKGRRVWRRAALVGWAVGLGALTAALATRAAWGQPPRAVRLTIEVDWQVPSVLTGGGAASPEAELRLNQGQVLEVVAWPPRAAEVEADRPSPSPDGAWKLGSRASGRVRARLEAPIEDVVGIVVGDQTVRVPILALLDGPQRTGPEAPVAVGVERLAWDAVEVELAEAGADGTVAPAALVPVTLRFNVLTPEPTDVSLHYVAELRSLGGGDPLWRTEGRARIATNASGPRAERVLMVPAPGVEGTYVLEVRASWEPLAGSEGSRLGRWLRRRRHPLSSSRRVTLAVVGPAPIPSAPPGAEPGGVVVDAVDLGRSRGLRAWVAGRTAEEGPTVWAIPEAALAEVLRRDRLLSLGRLARVGSEFPPLAPADDTGLAWAALSLKVPRPGRPHRLTITVGGGHPSALGVGLVAAGDPSERPRLLLDACGSDLPVLDDGPPATFSWLVWPDVAEPVLVLVNRGRSAPVRLSRVELVELAAVPGPPPRLEPPPSPSRAVGLDLSGPGALDRFGGRAPGGLGDALGAARNLTAYLDHLGASAVVLPSRSRDRTQRRALEGQAAEDSVGPDPIALAGRLVDRQGLDVWREVRFDDRLPGLPAPDSAEAKARGLIRLDRHGHATDATYHALHPEVRAALIRHLADRVATGDGRLRPAGWVVRLGLGPTLLGPPDTGLDDVTFTRFVQEALDDAIARGVPGLKQDAPDRFEARHRYLSGTGRVPWLKWRADEIAALYAEMARTVAREAPGARLAVVTPGLDDGPAGGEARRADLAGQAPHLAWRAVGLDLAAWPTGPDGPVVLRGVDLTTEALGHDLATSPELDEPVATRPERGMMISLERAARAGTPAPVLTAVPLADEELLGHALAALDARWVFLPPGAVAGHEERLRQFARVFTALPAPSATRPAHGRQPFGVAVRAQSAAAKTYLGLANDTPYPVRLETLLSGVPDETMVVDLGRSLRLMPETLAAEPRRRLVLDLPPFGVAAVRVDAPAVRVASVRPYPPAAVVANLKAQAEELSTRLGRLAEDRDEAEVPCPGFEPATGPPVTLAVAGGSAPVRGWRLVDDAADPANTAAIDTTNPRSGQGTLRLEVQTAPAAILSDPFAPPTASSLTVRGWLRAERSATKLRLWVEGQTAGAPFVRRSELTAHTDWTEVAVRVADLPPGGLDHLRLRFEMLAPGTLWLDDLVVAGERLSEPRRRNAQRTLMAALQAYQEGRYADFARLAGSHWARLAEPDPAAGATSSTSASALPADRRLR